MDIKAGMVVRFSPDACTEKEREYFLVVLESYEDRRQCLVRYLNAESEIAPIERVTWDMIVPTGATAENGVSA